LGETISHQGQLRKIYEFPRSQKIQTIQLFQNVKVTD